MHIDALMTGLAFPFGAPVSVDVCAEAMWIVHIAIAAPQCGQNADPCSIILLHRGHARFCAEDADGAAC